MELAVENKFEIWELNRTEVVVSGLLKFETFSNTYTFCRKSHQYMDFEFNNYYYEAMRCEISLNILESINNTLNDDCIEKIADNLDILGMADLVKTYPRLMDIARHRYSHLTINKSTTGKIGVMNFCYILNSFGEVVEEIRVSTDSFKGGRKKWNIETKYLIIFCIIHYTSSNLKSVHLHEFDIPLNHAKIEPLFSILNQRNIIVNMH